MSPARALAVATSAALVLACSGAPDGDPGGAAASGLTAATTDGWSGSATGTGVAAAQVNVIPVTVNGSRCSPHSYVNKPCVSVTVCTPGTTTCQTIDDVLLDTGSYGLRLFSQVLTVPLPSVAAGGGTLAECVQYASGASNWGRVATASVVLGGEPAVEVPIQIIDASFGAVPSSCVRVENGPADAGMNGVLGIGAFARDCGSSCSTLDRNGMYFACTASGCRGTAVSPSSQVQNPVTLLPQDNNGIVVSLPAVPASGAQSAEGALVLGIGTRGNNVPPAGLSTYALDGNGEFVTTVAGSSYGSFLDTGSNGLFFGPPSALSIPDCAAPSASWFCPADTLALEADVQGGATGTVSFQIGNFLHLFASNQAVFPDVGGRTPPATGFDWGLPFFFGRSVYLGFDGRSSTIGSGMYWAF